MSRARSDARRAVTRHLLVQASVLGVAVAAVATGCGSGATTASTQTLFARTSTALAAAHSFRITIDGTGSQNGQPRSVMHGEGVVDWTTGSADLRVTGSDSPGRLIITGGSMYLHRNSSTADQTLTKRPWLRVPIGHQSVLGGLDPLGDPLTTLSSLGDHMHGITNVGHAQLNGAPTTELIGSLSGAGKAHRTTTVTVWIDQQSRIRQLRMVGGGKGQDDLTEQFSDFGLPVHVVAPPADQVIDFDKLLKRAFAKVPAFDFPSPPTGIGVPPHSDALPSPTGRWTTQATGVSDGISWRLATAAASRDGECLATITTPALGQISSDHDADGGGTDSSLPPSDYRGLPANCGPAPNPHDNEGDYPIVQVLDADRLAQSGSGRHYVSGIANPHVQTLVAELSDGSTAPVTLHDGVFFSTWTGPRRLAAMTFSYPPDPSLTCTADTGSGYDVGDLTCD